MHDVLKVQRAETGKQSKFNATQVERIVRLVTTAVLVGLGEALSDGHSDDWQEGDQGLSLGNDYLDKVASAGSQNMFDFKMIDFARYSALPLLSSVIAFVAIWFIARSVPRKRKEKRAEEEVEEKKRKMPQPKSRAESAGSNEEFTTPLSEVLKKLKERRDELERTREEQIMKIEDFYNLKCRELKKTEDEVHHKMSELQEGYGCIEEAWARTKAFRNAMGKTYELMLKAEKMPRSGVKHLFDDVDTRSTVSARSEKGKKLEAAMLRAKELQAEINKEKEEKAQKEQKKKEQKAPGSQERREAGKGSCAAKREEKA